ncbi:MAG: cytochrome b [Caulobacteraceae bacterium]
MQPRYSHIHQALHWITALFLFTILPLAWVMTHAKHGAPYVSDLINWHRTLGLLVLAITLFRIVWRLIDKPPPYPQGVAVWDRGLAHATYWIFLLALVWMPVTGYLMTSFGGHGVKFFDIIEAPSPLAPDKAMDHLFDTLHDAGQWAIYALIALHLGAVVLHTIWGRDGVLGRMLPRSATELGE